MFRSKLTIALLLCPFLTFAQARPTSETSYTISKPYQVIDAREKQYFSEKDEVMTVKINNKVINLQKFNGQKLTLIKATEYVDMPKGYDVEDVIKFNGKIYLFYSAFDKSTDNEQLFSREIDFRTGAFTGPGKLILKVARPIVAGGIEGPSNMFGVGFTRTVDKFDIYTSYDSTKIMVQYRCKPEVRNDAKSYDEIGLHVFDYKMKKLWGYDVRMPYTEKKMNNIDYGVDGSGNAYILTTVFNDNTTQIKKDKDGPANYHIELLRIKAGTKDVETTKIKLNDKFINKIWMYEMPGNFMVCAGFYNNGKDYSAANGVFMFRAAQDGTVDNLKSYEIPVSVINQYNSAGTQRKNLKKEKDDKAEFDELVLRELLVQDDGSIIIVGEQYYVIVHTHYNGRTTTTTRTYHYNDLLVTKINPDGELAWMKKLPKRQKSSSGKGGLSYKYMKDTDNGDHYFLFLDNVKNMTLNTSEVPDLHIDGRGGYLTSYKVTDGEGKITKSSILDITDAKGIELYQFSTDRILPLTSGNFVFETYKKDKEDVLIKVNLKANK